MECFLGCFPQVKNKICIVSFCRRMFVK
jgi:hypothetical protein